MKKTKLLLLSLFLLFGCNNPSSSENSSISSSSDSSINESSSSVESSSSSSAEKSSSISSEEISSIPSSEDQQNIVIDFDFVGFETNEGAMNFFASSWSTSGSIFSENDLKLTKDIGYVRSPAYQTFRSRIEVSLTSHITNLHNLNQSALGEVFEFKVEALDDNEDFEFEVIDSVTYRHEVTQDDITNQSFLDYPTYTSDYSNDPYTVILEGEGIKRVRVSMVTKISFTSDSNQPTGCNLGIHNLKVVNLM